MSLPVVDLMSLAYLRQYNEICRLLDNAEEHPERVVCVSIRAYSGLVDMAKRRKKDQDQWMLAS